MQKVPGVYSPGKMQAGLGVPSAPNRGRPSVDRTISIIYEFWKL